MSEPFVGEIRIFAGNFAPRGWALCNGQPLPIAQNTALFALVGAIYGGDGRTTFHLPDLQGRIPLHAGRGPELPFTFNIGQRGGAESHTLTLNEMPSHTHAIGVTSQDATTGTPGPGTVLAVADSNVYDGGSDLEPLRDEVGGGRPHNNLQPFLTLTFIVALTGVFPSRS